MATLCGWYFAGNFTIVPNVKNNPYFIFNFVLNLILSSCKQSIVNSWYYTKIKADVLLKEEKVKDIIVGVIDSGINKEFLQLFDVDSIVEGYDFVDNDDKPYSKYNLHGGYISYLIAGKEYDGFMGIDSRLKVMPIRVFDESGNTSSELIFKGIEYAIDNGCSVINMSFASAKYDYNLEYLIQTNKEIKFVASVGDFSANEFYYPAKYDDVIAVSAVDKEGELYSYSNTSNIDQSILSPGVDLPIISVNINGDIIKTTVSGSSYATAIISGIIGSLILSDSLNEEALTLSDVYTDDYLDCKKLTTRY